MGCFIGGYMKVVGDQLAKFLRVGAFRNYCATRASTVIALKCSFSTSSQGPFFN